MAGLKRWTTPLAWLLLAASLAACALFSLQWHAARRINAMIGARTIETMKPLPDDARVRYAAAWDLERTQHFDEAIRLYTDAQATTDPVLASHAWFALGNVYFEQGIKATREPEARDAQPRVPSSISRAMRIAPRCASIRSCMTRATTLSCSSVSRRRTRAKDGGATPIRSRSSRPGTTAGRRSRKVRSVACHERAAANLGLRHRARLLVLALALLVLLPVFFAPKVRLPGGTFCMAVRDRHQRKHERARRRCAPTRANRGSIARRRRWSLRWEAFRADRAQPSRYSRARTP